MDEKTVLTGISRSMIMVTAVVVVVVEVEGVSFGVVGDVVFS